MLEKVILKNFKSFKKETSIDFAKTNYASLPQNVADNGVLKGCIFVGDNASGKSNIILSIKLLLDFLFLERDTNSGMFLCLFGDEPHYSLDYYFVIDGRHIRYYFQIHRKRGVTEEKLWLDDNLLMERLGDSAKSYIADPAGVLYDETDVAQDTLFLRTLFFNTKFSSNKVLKEWMEFLSNSVYINLYEKEIIPYRKNETGLLEYLEKNGCAEINGFFDQNHFEQNIEYAHSSEGKNVTVVMGDDENKKNIFFKRKGIEEPIPFQMESIGNRNLLRLIPPFFYVIRQNGILLLDEFSSGFHNDLEELLIKYFMNHSAHAQMFFVSHSTNLLSNSLLRPDQEYSVDFFEESGSKVNRFSTEHPRMAQNTEKMYRSGVFGGLPRYREERE